ncbi:hypothetical protein FVQ98_00325 [Ottowia sp. GY511]|uniref:Dienelactone hydrolase domain-containing protein n=1 Tax=Ottowia flava TaxID=2675430 RepID=A0ABW4KVE1_9BURK|nr:hypothetical protein [Ottowia sp. GY511]TXK33367.1 hypothetical protein FVQ98_00325 [Ottowia sp. GY511]
MLTFTGLAHGATGLVQLPATATHGRMAIVYPSDAALSQSPPKLPPRAARVMDDPPGCHRREIPRAYAAIVQFFNQQLCPTAATPSSQPG